MPWTQERFPPAMRGLPPEVRLRAIEIANAMLAEGCDDGQAIRMGIAAAKKWASRQLLSPGLTERRRPSFNGERFSEPALQKPAPAADAGTWTPQ